MFSAYVNLKKLHSMSLLKQQHQHRPIHRATSHIFTCISQVSYCCLQWQLFSTYSNACSASEIDDSVLLNVSLGAGRRLDTRRLRISWLRQSKYVIWRRIPHPLQVTRASAEQKPHEASMKAIIFKIGLYSFVVSIPHKSVKLELTLPPACIVQAALY